MYLQIFVNLNSIKRVMQFLASFFVKILGVKRTSTRQVFFFLNGPKSEASNEFSFFRAKHYLSLICL